MTHRLTPNGTRPLFLGLSTGRSGSRYLASLLNEAGIKTLHETSRPIAELLEQAGTGALRAINADPKYRDVRGEVSAHFVTQVEAPLAAQVWHFSRHPQPFVSSLIKFGFWRMKAPSIHPYLRCNGDQVADSFRYWLDWNQRIMGITQPPQRTTFRIEDLSRELIARLADTIGADADVTKIDPVWNEKQEFAAIPTDIEAEVGEMMEVLGYAQAG